MEPSDRIELQPVTNGNDAGAHANGQDSVDASLKTSDAERKRLLEIAPTTNGNAVAIDVDSDTPEIQQKSFVEQIKGELSEKVCKNKVPLWVVLILILVLVVCLIFASLALCAVMYDDPDEEYDATHFDVSRNFSGSFRLANMNSTEKLHLAANGNRPLAAELEKMLDELYTNSPALGRYFSRSEVYNFSDGPVTALYRLMFRMPAKEENLLTNYTLSREMVYNVFRQFLYDQEVDPSDRLYIEPASLNMSE